MKTESNDPVINSIIILSILSLTSLILSLINMILLIQML
jgi:hypothetical protein